MKNTPTLLAAVCYLIALGFTLYATFNIYPNYASGNIDKATFWAVICVWGKVCMQEYEAKYPIRKPN